MLPSGNTSTLRIEPVVPYCLLQRGEGRAGALEHEGIRGRDEGERRLAHHVEVDTGHGNGAAPSPCRTCPSCGAPPGARRPTATSAARFTAPRERAQPTAAAVGSRRVA